ncbi:hypothetical protein EYF80_011116 [Liparis tanakae]|uniref:Uncharacterized protein n=1 Tax=Liparis tanakae TaxID=230148 RepID=A0A4Z2INB5_9TELE|nr:hypothetical protein EYF80_011116 [Liparis tanakae]
MVGGKKSVKVITCDGQEGVGVLVRAQGSLPGSLLEVLDQTLEVLHALLRLRLDDHPGCPQNSQDVVQVQRVVRHADGVGLGRHADQIVGQDGAEEPGIFDDASQVL